MPASDGTNRWTMVAESIINPRRIVKMGTGDNQVLEATGPTEDLHGVSCNDEVIQIGDRVDVITHGPALLTMGGTVPRGSKITAGTGGKGVAAAPGAGVSHNTIAFQSFNSRVLNDLAEVEVERDRIQG